MWNWVKNAVSWAGNTVKKVVKTVKNASDIIDKVSSTNVSTVSTPSTVSRVSDVQNSNAAKSWKEKYNEITNKLANTIKG